jgi:hypothetical protein
LQRRPLAVRRRVEPKLTGRARHRREGMPMSVLSIGQQC